MCGIREKAGGRLFSQTKLLAGVTCSFDEPSPQSPQAGATSESPLTWLTLFPCPGDSFRPYPIQLAAPPTISVAFLYEWLVLAHASDFPKIAKTSRIEPQHTLYLLLSDLRPSTSSNSFGSQLGLTGAPSSPAQVAATYRLLCSSCQ